MQNIGKKLGVVIVIAIGSTIILIRGLPQDTSRNVSQLPSSTNSGENSQPMKITIPERVSQIICSPSIWQYVYHADRLPTKNDCRTVTGVVQWVKHEDDGDYHIRLQLDDPNSAPVNSKNIGGYLIVEPICQVQGMPVPKQADAVQACQEYVAARMTQWSMPNVGDHLKVTGFYSLDTQHGWFELHSVVEITKI